MLETLRASFREELKNNPNLIVQNHSLAKGVYILVDKSGEYKELIVTKEKSNSEDPLYNVFKELDIYSICITTNKAYFDKKIQSCVYTAVSLKGENLKPPKKASSGKWDVNDALEKILKNFDVYENPRLKYKGPKLKLYEKIEEEYKKVDKESLEFFKDWLENNLHDIAERYEDLKPEYIKIFLDENIETYKIENLKYLKLNILTNPKFLENGEVIGVHSFNSNLNEKKTFLLTETKKCKYSYLVSTEVAIEYHWISKLFDGFIKNHKKIVYVGDNSIEGYDKKELDLIKIKSKKPKYVLYLESEKYKTIIKDFDTLNNFEAEPIELNFKNVIERKNFEIAEDSYLKNLKSKGLGADRLDRFELVMLIDSMFFSKYLYSNLFNDITINKLPSEISKTTLKSLIHNYKMQTKDFLYKGIDKYFKSRFKDISLESLKMYLNKYGATNSNIERFITREAILDYIEGERNMDNRFKVLYQNLVKKQSTCSIDNTIDSIEEYSFLVGQLVNYLNSLSNAKNSNNTLSSINTYLNARNDEALKRELRRLFKVYNYKLESRKSVRFKHLYSLVLGYEPTEKHNEDFMIGGYLYKNVIFEPGNNAPTDDEVVDSDDIDNNLVDIEVDAVEVFNS